MRFAVLGLAIVLVVAAPAAAQNGPSKCTAQKTKALGIHAQLLAGCRSKALAKGVAVDPLCVAKALAKLQKAFERAERKQDCLEVGDDEFAARQTEDYLTRAATVIEDEAICCTIGGLQCLYVTTDADCDGLEGTVGAAGSVCDGSGGCTAGPATGGTCCSGIALGTGCAIGTTEPSCEINGGTFLSGGACRPTGTCALPK
jgi:hypothetical protein